MSSLTRSLGTRSFAGHALTATVIATVAGLATPAQAQRFQRLDGTGDNERSYDIEHTTDAGYVTAGSVEIIDPTNGALDEDFYIIKHRRDGFVEWRTRYGGLARDRATSIHQTQDGGYIVAGHTESAQPGLGLALLRLDPLGNPLWANAYEASAFERVYNPAEPAYLLQPAVRESRENGDIIVVTNIRNTVGGQHPVYLRTDPAGSPLTNIAYADGALNEATFAGFTDLKELDDGSICITGFWSLADPNPDGVPFVLETDVLALRIEFAGIPFWSFHYDDTISDPSDEAGHGLDVSADNRLMTIGAIETHQDAAGLPTVVGSLHLELDTSSGLLNNSHFLHDMTPAYAATRYNKDLLTTTSGIDLSPTITGSAGPGAAVRLKPGLVASDRYTLYGPFTNFREKLEAVAVTDLTCGYIFTGPKTSVGFGGADQLLVKTNDTNNFLCHTKELDPLEQIPDIQQIQIDLVAQFHDNWSRWGDQRSWDTNERILCFNIQCPCKVDFNGDGFVDNGDIATFITLFLNGDPRADCNGDGILDNGDISAFIVAFLAGC